MADLLVAGIVLALAGAAAAYIARQKKKGVKCIGCPNGGCCSGNCSGHASCSSCQSKR